MLTEDLADDSRKVFSPLRTQVRVFYLFFNMASNSAPAVQNTQNTVDLFLEDFDFSSPSALQALLQALDVNGQIKVLKKLASMPAVRFAEIIRNNTTVRRLLLRYHQAVLPVQGVIGTMEVDRTIVRNDSLRSASIKYLGICDFRAEKIAAFTCYLLQHMFR